MSPFSRLLFVSVFLSLVAFGCGRADPARGPRSSNASGTVEDAALQRGSVQKKRQPSKVKDPYLQHALAAMADGEYVSAIKAFNDAEERGNHAPELYIGRAMCYRALGEPGKAILDFRKVAAAPAGDATPIFRAAAYDGLSDAYLRLGKWQLALNCAQTSCRLKPEGSVAQANKGEALFRLGRYKEAVVSLEIAMKDWKNLKEASEHEARALRCRLAEAYEHLGETEKAAKERQFLLAPHTISEANKKKADELASVFKHTVETRHMIVHTDLENVQFQLNFLEHFLNYIDREMLPLPAGFKLHLYVLPDREKLALFMSKHLSGQGDPTGNSIFTYQASGLGSCAHQATSKVIDACCPWIDEWARNGVPAFFEKIYCLIQRQYEKDEKGHNDKFVVGFQNPWRIEALGKDLEAVDLKKSVAYRVRIHYSEQSADRLLAMYLYRQGKLKHFLELAREGKIGKFGSIFENALEQSLGGIEPQFRQYLRSVASRRASIKEIPESRMFERRSDLESFLASHKKVLDDAW